MTNEIIINNSGTLTINGNGANVLTIDGGAGTNRIFYINQATATISGVTLTGGNGVSTNFDSFGGAVFVNGGSLTLDSVDVKNNTTSNGGGGFYFLASNATIRNSTISGNSTPANGGGGFEADNANVTITNSTISGNTADNTGGGFFSYFSNVTLRNSTITRNTGGSGGGITNIGRTLNLGNTIVAGNTGGDIFFSSGSLITAGFNLIGNNSSVETIFPAGNPNANNDIVGTSGSPIDPKLGGLTIANGGTTPTHALLVGSPAVDAGNNALASEAFDQRGTGFPRIIDGDGNGTAIVDIGAFEVQSAVTAATVSIGGRVMTMSGRGIMNVRLSLTDSQGNARMATSTAFGYYHFDDVQAGETYIISASAKRYTFSLQSQALNINEDTEEINFIASPIKR